MVELRNLWWNTEVFVFQLVVGCWSWMATKDLKIVWGNVFCVAFLSIFAALFKRDNERQIAGVLLGIGSISALLFFVHWLSFTDSVFQHYYWVWIFAAGLASAGTTAREDNDSWEDQLCNTLANLPLGVGAVIGGAILLWQKWEERERW